MSGLSRNYFLKLFKETYKTTPKSYLIHFKIDQATRYLLETDMSIHELSEILGYENQFCFSKQYKAVTGTSPSGLRRSYIETIE